MFLSFTQRCIHSMLQSHSRYSVWNSLRHTKCNLDRMASELNCTFALRWLSLCVEAHSCSISPRAHTVPSTGCGFLPSERMSNVWAQDPFPPDPGLTLLSIKDGMWTKSILRLWNTFLKPRVLEYHIHVPFVYQTSMDLSSSLWRYYWKLKLSPFVPASPPCSWLKCLQTLLILTAYSNIWLLRMVTFCLSDYDD